MSVLPRGDWMEIDVERWDRVMEVNLRGIFVCCRAVVPQMPGAGRRQDRQHLVRPVLDGRAQPARLLDLQGRRDRAHPLAGDRGWPLQYLRQRDHAGLHAERTPRSLPSGDYAQKNEPPPGRIIRRHQYPDDLVGAVMFLMSAGSDFITGQTVNVDGGQSMH